MKSIPLTAKAGDLAVFTRSRTEGLSLNSVPALARRLYPFVSDAKSVSNEALFALLGRSSGKALKAVRTGRHERFPRNVVTAFLWCAALAERKGIELEKEFWNAYPGECPYCHFETCGCDPQNRPAERTAVRPKARTRPRTVRGFQTLSAKIYPPVDTADTGLHFAEELLELLAVFHMRSAFRLTDREGAAFEDPFRVEIIDVLSHLFKVSTFMRFDLEGGLLEREKFGCHQCNSAPCACIPDDFLGDAHK